MTLHEAQRPDSTALGPGSGAVSSEGSPASRGGWLVLASVCLLLSSAACVPPWGKELLTLSLNFPKTTCVSGDGFSTKKQGDQSLWGSPELLGWGREWALELGEAAGGVQRLGATVASMEMVCIAVDRPGPRVYLSMGITPRACGAV